jgi:ORF6N domain
MAKTFPTERIENSILFIRGQKVILDAVLAELYEVPIKALNQAVKRNRSRFPEDFMFQLSRQEAEFLRSQNVTLKGRGEHRKYLPFAFS